MIAIALQSGSSGNCIYVEHDGVGLLFDAGISGVMAEERLAACGRDIRRAAALIVSHDHSDHARCAGIYHRKFGLPVYITEETHAAACHRLGRINAPRAFAPGETLRFGTITVETVATAHDAVEGVAFIVAAGGRRLGILTDLGHVFAGLDAVVHSLDGIFLESNYDPAMLAGGSYPRWLQERIRGPRGHISNREAAELLRLAAGPQLQWVCLAHLSEENNSPALALRTHKEVADGAYPLHVADRYAAIPALTL